VKALGTELDFTAQAETTSGALPAIMPRQSEGMGRYWLVGVAAPFQVSRESRVTVGFSYAKGEAAFSSKARGRSRRVRVAVGRGVLTVSYSHTF